MAMHLRTVVAADGFLMRHWDVILLVLCVGALFFLQASTLRLTAHPDTDEAVHVEAGRMMLEGMLPYRDFYYPHTPVLPLLLAAGWAVFHALYPLRLLYLAANMAAACVFFVVFRFLTKDRLAALVAILVYLTYDQMVHHDFRFIVMREVANMFLAGFLFFALVKPRVRGSTVIQTAFACLAVFTFLPSALNLFCWSLGIILLDPAPARRRALLLHFIDVGLVCLSALVLFFLLPYSLRLVLLDHFVMKTGGTFLGRLPGFFTLRSPHAIFYLAGVFGLVTSVFLAPRFRWLSLLLLASVFSVLATGEFFAHYLVAAAPAMAFGIALLLTQLRGITGRVSPALPIVAALTLLAVHLAIALPSLADEWAATNPGYYDTVRLLRTLPQPLLTFTEPNYAEDADVRSVHFYYAAAMRALYLLRVQLRTQEYNRLAGQACTIFLTPWDRSVVPPAVQLAWLRRYRQLPSPQGTFLFLTDNAGCGGAN